MADTAGRNSVPDASTAELVRQLSDQTSTLIRDEMALVKAEISEKGKKAGIGAGMFGGAGIFGFYAFGAFTAALIAVISLGVDTWIAAAIVTVVYAAIAGVLALQGKNKVQDATPPVRSVESVKEDIQVTKERARSGRA
jgi:lipopolysaccharide export LptBFGC system permease protein LptF